MGRVYKKYLVSDIIYTCSHCKTHLSTYADIVSKAYIGRIGRAYLYRDLYVFTCCSQQSMCSRVQSVYNLSNLYINR